MMKGAWDTGQAGQAGAGKEDHQTTSKLSKLRFSKLGDPPKSLFGNTPLLTS